MLGPTRSLPGEATSKSRWKTELKVNLKLHREVFRTPMECAYEENAMHFCTHFPHWTLTDSPAPALPHLLSHIFQTSPTAAGQQGAVGHHSLPERWVGKEALLLGSLLLLPRPGSCFLGCPSLSGGWKGLSGLVEQAATSQQLTLWSWLCLAGRVLMGQTSDQPPRGLLIIHHWGSLGRGIREPPPHTLHSR